MCVILVAETGRLTPRMIDLAVDRNPDGNGLAWIERKSVRFEKDLSAADVREMLDWLPLPYVFHARIATVGGVCPELCHPFPLDRRVKPLALAGWSPKGVLFHNGHWGAWKQFADPSKVIGLWSDSR